MSAFEDARILYDRTQLEALVSERYGMIAANAISIQAGEPCRYTEQHFLDNAAQMRGCAPDFRNFSS